MDELTREELERELAEARETIERLRAEVNHNAQLARDEQKARQVAERDAMQLASFISMYQKYEDLWPLARAVLVEHYALDMETRRDAAKGGANGNLEW